MHKIIAAIFTFISVLFNIVLAADEISDLADRGKILYSNKTSCVLCHGEKAEGIVGPSLQFGPTPFDIHYQLNTNTQMAAIRDQLKPENDDLVALSVYIRKLAGDDMSTVDMAGLRATLNSIPAPGEEIDFIMTERDLAVAKIESFDTVLKDWKRRAKSGNIKKNYDVKVTSTFPAGKARFKPQPGKTYFYENTGAYAAGGSGRPATGGTVPTAENTMVIVGDAETKKVIAWNELPPELRGQVHTTVMSPDGKYVYIIGAKPYSGPDSIFSLTTPATLVKVDAITLEPVKQMMVGSRLHHGQIFQDKYLLLDTFAKDRDGLDVYLYDPETDEIIGGIRDEEMGGSTYTSWTDDEFIYVLMEPLGYSQPVFSGYIAASNRSKGTLTMTRPFWVAKLDPKTWQVVQEYPYPGTRGDWITFDAEKEHMYIPSGGSSNLSKIDLKTGKVVWSSPTGIGPYGAGLTADENEIWVADKGETAGFFGRTISVIKTSSGKQVDTLFSAFEVDHVLLAPNGKEFWLTSNGEGRIYVFDAESRKRTHMIDMPKFGDPHGLVWVHYDEQGNSKVVRDQGGFHNGINPKKGMVLNY